MELGVLATGCEEGVIGARDGEGGDGVGYEGELDEPSWGLEPSVNTRATVGSTSTTYGVGGEEVVLDDTLVPDISNDTPLVRAYRHVS